MDNLKCENLKTDLLTDILDSLYNDGICSKKFDVKLKNKAIPCIAKCFYKEFCCCNIQAPPASGGSDKL